MQSPGVGVLMKQVATWESRPRSNHVMDSFVSHSNSLLTSVTLNVKQLLLLSLLLRYLTSSFKPILNGSHPIIVAHTVVIWKQLTLDSRSS